MKNKNFTNRDWYIIDATNMILGRLASKISYIIQGKNKPEYCFNTDIGDYIIIKNVNKICVTGNKLNNKFYYKHTGYVGGLKKILFKKLISEKPEYILRNAVKGMIPKNKLGNKMIKRLKIYKYYNDFHISQNPKKLDL